MNSVTSLLYRNILIDIFLKKCIVKEKENLIAKDFKIMLIEELQRDRNFEMFKKFFHKININPSQSTVIFTTQTGEDIIKALF